MVDPITLELIAEGLTSIVREMRAIVIRTAYSAMIHEGHDFSCAVLTAGGDLLAASQVDQPTHLSALPWSARTILAKYAHDMREGDLFVHNDPYTGGTHLNDVVLIHPMFQENRPVAQLGVMAHWQDVGGMVPGSLSGGATEIYQEGIRIPAIRIARDGKLVPEVAELMLANMRGPDDRRGDLSAMVGACRIAEGKIRRIIERWGGATFAEASDLLLDRAEARMRAAIGQLPAGAYSYETYLDHVSGSDARPLPLRLTLHVGNGEIHADFSGCPPQVDGPTNLGPAHAWTATYTMVKAFLDPTSPINAGALRPIRVTAPLGTVINAKPPAACGAIGEVRRALEGLVMGTLGMSDPERCVGDLKGASNITTVGGFDSRRGRSFAFVEFPAGGTGAWIGADGNNTVRNFAEGDLSSIQPVEAIENAYPLRVERSILRQDSGGAGRRRGGLGLRRDVRLLEGEAFLSVLSDRNVIPPYGVRQGLGGVPNRFTVIRNGDEVAPSPLPGKVTGFKMRADDILVMRTAGGGGLGDPLEREAEMVLADVHYGYVSAQQARDVYGVVIHRGKLDTRATLALREEMRAQRYWLTSVLLTGPEFSDNRRVAGISKHCASRLGLAAGTLIEVPNASGPSLRAWTRIEPDLADDACAIGPSGLRVLGVTAGERLWVRPVRQRLDEH
jgi:N-methylhydantoinase B